MRRSLLGQDGEEGPVGRRPVCAKEPEREGLGEGRGVPGGGGGSSVVVGDSEGGGNKLFPANASAILERIPTPLPIRKVLVPVARLPRPSFPELPRGAVIFPMWSSGVRLHPEVVGAGRRDGGAEGREHCKERRGPALCSLLSLDLPEPQGHGLHHLPVKRSA